MGLGEHVQGQATGTEKSQQQVLDPPFLPSVGCHPRWVIYPIYVLTKETHKTQQKGVQSWTDICTQKTLSLLN